MCTVWLATISLFYLLACLTLACKSKVLIKVKGWPINFGINCNSLLLFFSTKELPGQSSIIEEEQWNFRPLYVSPSSDGLKR